MLCVVLCVMRCALCVVRVCCVVRCVIWVEYRVLSVVFVLRGVCRVFCDVCCLCLSFDTFAVYRQRQVVTEFIQNQEIFLKIR